MDISEFSGQSCHFQFAKFLDWSVGRALILYFRQDRGIELELIDLSEIDKHNLSKNGTNWSTLDIDLKAAHIDLKAACVQKRVRLKVRPQSSESQARVGPPGGRESRCPPPPGPAGDRATIIRGGRGWQDGDHRWPESIEGLGGAQGSIAGAVASPPGRTRDPQRVKGRTRIILSARSFRQDSQRLKPGQPVETRGGYRQSYSDSVEANRIPPWLRSPVPTCGGIRVTSQIQVGREISEAAQSKA